MLYKFLDIKTKYPKALTPEQKREATSIAIRSLKWTGAKVVLISVAMTGESMPSVDQMSLVLRFILSIKHPVTHALDVSLTSKVFSTLKKKCEDGRADAIATCLSDESGEEEYDFGEEGEEEGEGEEEEAASVTKRPRSNAKSTKTLKR